MTDAQKKSFFDELTKISMVGEVPKVTLRDVASNPKPPTAKTPPIRVPKPPTLFKKI